MAVVSAWRRVRAAAHRIEQMCLAPRTDSRNRQTASARETGRSNAIAALRRSTADATCLDGPLLRRTD